MLNTGIPPTFICWICSFLIDCKGRVQLFNISSSSRKFNQGLPQDSVLAPLLFLFYIKDLAATLDNDTVIALFADYVSFLTTGRKREDAEATAQSLVNSVVTCSQEGKLNLNAEKSEACPFSTGSNDNSWNPTIFTGTRRVRVNSTPRFIGVILDKLNFQCTVEETNHFAWISHTYYQSYCPYFLGLAPLTTMAFHALVCSKLDYAAPAWQPSLSVTNLSNLDCLQNHSLWLITGQLVSTSLEALWLEANV